MKIILSVLCIFLCTHVNSQTTLLKEADQDSLLDRTQADDTVELGSKSTDTTTIQVDNSYKTVPDSIANKDFLSWVNKVYDFGKIQMDEPVTGQFEFVNKTNDVVFITKVDGTCDCTGTEFPLEPIPPGGKGTIKATYDAKALGPFSKGVQVFHNLKPAPTWLEIKGEVEWDFMEH